MFSLNISPSCFKPPELVSETPIYQLYSLFSSNFLYVEPQGKNFINTGVGFNSDISTLYFLTLSKNCLDLGLTLCLPAFGMLNNIELLSLPVFNARQAAYFTSDIFSQLYGAENRIKIDKGFHVADILIYK